MIKRLKTSVLLVVFMTGCGPYHYPAGSFVPGSPATIWVMKRFAVGKQCIRGPWDDEYAHELAIIKAELADGNILVYEEKSLKGPSCRSCNCSALTGFYYVRINVALEDWAIQNGFSLTSPPD